MVALALHEGGAPPRDAALLLAVHESSGATVWDARFTVWIALLAI